MDNKSVKENIIRQRKRQKLSQMEVAERIGVSRTAYRNIEKGGTRLLNDRIGCIADVLEINPVELVLGYLPDKYSATDSLEDGNSYRLKYEKLEKQRTDVINRQLKEINQLNSLLSAQRDQISMLKDLLKTKEEIIEMLKKSQQMKME